MHTLFVRIFTLFLISMALIVGGSIAVTFTFMMAARDYESSELQRRPNLAIEASEVLDGGGVPALRGWLKTHNNTVADHDLYIVGPDGKDLLGRRLSENGRRRLEFLTRDSLNGGEPHVHHQPPGNFRAARLVPQIIAPDGAAYTVLWLQRRPGVFGALSLPGVSLAILCIALTVSALTSWWLARHLSAPIKRIQEGARALAAERLDMRDDAVRVSAGLEGRRDEVAVLARDFDAMAGQLRANRHALTQLLRDISHELRSPLARMRVAVGLARRPAAELPRQLDRLEREIERLDDLIGQVLKLARLNGSDAPFVREDIDLDEVIEHVVRDANFEGAVKGCSIVLSGAARTRLRGNREFLGSAIENVLRNAVRYSPDGSPVEVSIGEPDPGRVSIVVRDHGPGVPNGELQRIFEPFYRVAESRDRNTGGEGIGLAITAQVMKTHGGSAAAHNRAEGGLEVTLILPRAA